MDFYAALVVKMTLAQALEGIKQEQDVVDARQQEIPSSHTGEAAKHVCMPVCTRVRSVYMCTFMCVYMCEECVHLCVCTCVSSVYIYVCVHV